VSANRHFGSTKPNVFNVANPSQIANSAVRMDQNVHNASHQIASPIISNQNAFVSTLNMKINKLRNANSATLIKTV